MKYITITIALLSLSLLQSCGNKKFASDLKRTHQSTAVDTNGCTAVKESVNESNHQDYLYKGSIIDSAYRKYISYWKSRDSAELNVLKKTDGAVFRPEPTILAIKTDVGDTVYYIDWCVASADEPLYGRLYRLEDYLPAFKLCIIKNSHATPTFNYIQFISTETGERFDSIPGLPMVSPDGKRFITYYPYQEFDPGLGPDDFPSGLIIWEKNGKNIAKVYEKKWGRTIAKWIDNTRIALEWSLFLKLDDDESTVFVLDTLVYSLDNWYLETDGKCITSENKTPFAVKDLGDNIEEGVKYNDPEDIIFNVTVLKKTSPEKSEYPICGDEKSARIIKYIRQLTNCFMYVRLVAIEGLGQIDDQRAAKALHDFISNPENSNEDNLSVMFACLALKSSKALVEEYKNFVDSELAQIEMKWNETIPAQDSSKEAMQSNQKIGLEDVFNGIVDVTFANAGMNLHYRPVDNKMLDTLVLETDHNVHGAVIKILKSAEEENLWASRFLILRSCLNSQSKRLRIWALEKLSEEETWHSRALIKSVLDDKDADIRNAAAEALKENYQINE